MMVVQHDGWWWPSDDRDARRVIVRDANDAVAGLLKHVEGRTCIIQAGGNVGVYPVALADHFRRVITFEPDPINAQCLWRNIEARDSLKRIDARQAALGEEIGSCAMVEVEVGNCGAHRIDPERGNIVVLPIDALDLIACDAIWLDIEGFEHAALKGARATIERFSPVIAFEDKGLDRAYGVPPGETAAWLKGLGYSQIDKLGNDKVFRRLSQ